MPNKKTWREKLETANGPPKVGKIEGKMSQRWGTGTMVIPAPLEVDAAMKSIRKGKLTTIELIREALAEKHDVTIACPVTTGIFAWIASHAAEEAEAEGGVKVWMGNQSRCRQPEFSPSIKPRHGSPAIQLVPSFAAFDILPNSAERHLEGCR